MISMKNGVMSDARGIPFAVGQEVIFTPSGERQQVMLAEVVDLGKNNILLSRIRDLRGGENPYSKDTIRTTSSTMVIVEKLPALTP
jgi:hypothetical protein